jgi:hypothetical protein
MDKKEISQKKLGEQAFDIDNESICSYIESKSEIEQQPQINKEPEDNLDHIQENFEYNTSYLEDDGESPNSLKQDLLKRFNENPGLYQQLSEKSTEDEKKSKLETTESTQSLDKKKPLEVNDELMYIIKDLDTGTVTDIRNMHITSTVPSKSKKEIKIPHHEKAWDEYWFVRKNEGVYLNMYNKAK